MTHLCETVDSMEHANYTPSVPNELAGGDKPLPRADFREFRLDAIALNPDLGRVTGDEVLPGLDEPESTGAWILADDTCSSILTWVVEDVSRLQVVGASVGISPSRYAVVRALGFAYCEAPLNALAYGSFLCKFVWRCIALTGRCHVAYGVSAQARRRAASSP